METQSAARNYANGGVSATLKDQGRTREAQDDIDRLIENAHDLLNMLEEKLHPILMNVPTPLGDTAKEERPPAVTPFHDSQLVQQRELSQLVSRLAQLRDRIDL